MPGPDDTNSHVELLTDEARASHEELLIREESFGPEDDEQQRVAIVINEELFAVLTRAEVEQEAEGFVKVGYRVNEEGNFEAAAIDGDCVFNPGGG